MRSASRSTALVVARSVAMRNFDLERALACVGSRDDEQDVDSRYFGCAIQLY